MSCTRESAFVPASSFALFADWISLLREEVKKCGGNEDSIHAFFADKDKIADIAKLILRNDGKMEGASQPAARSDSGMGDLLRPIIAERKPFVGNEYLKLVPTKEELVLDPQDGSALLSEQTGLFRYVAITLKEKTDKRGEATEEQKVAVYELMKDAKAATVFDSVGADLDMLCLTQAQIINFVCKYWKWIPVEESALFFLFKCGPEFFVARMFKSKGAGLRIVLFHALDEGNMWHVMHKHRVVLPLVEA